MHKPNVDRPHTTLDTVHCQVVGPKPIETHLTPPPSLHQATSMQIMFPFCLSLFQPHLPVLSHGCMDCVLWCWVASTWASTSAWCY
mmetsp:Transcript_24450/g.44327  ORF Transcript_24450/g.44327 Transcript_24450/m.44327 type:complete len:86 (-) Transcript_24450:1187-1444(-)